MTKESRHAYRRLGADPTRSSVKSKAAVGERLRIRRVTGTIHGLRRRTNKLRQIMAIARRRTHPCSKSCVRFSVASTDT